MRIIHAPTEIAGQMGLLCAGLRKMGHEAFGYNWFLNYLKYSGHVINTDLYELTKMIPVIVGYCDILHFHNGNTFLLHNHDLPFLYGMGKKMVMHHRGNDVRFPSLARKGPGYENPYVYTGDSLDEKTIEKNLQLFSQAVDAAIVQDYELYHYVVDYYRKQGKPVYVLPRLINTAEYRPLPPDKDNRHPLVVHAPTLRQFKGSSYIEKAVKQLQKEASFTYVELSSKSHREVQALFARADIVIDQVLCGAYGNVSVEAMAYAKPVICYIRPDLVKTYPDDLPIISANPDNLFDRLKRLVLDPGLRHDAGLRGRHYVEKQHDAAKVIKQLLDIYSSLL